METKQTTKRSTDAPAEAVASTMPPMYVRRGRTVQIPSGTYGPGAMIENLSRQDFDHMLGAGFIQSEPPVLEPSALENATKNPSGIGLQNKQIHQGPDYNR